jgi:hypothetical protein
LHLAIDGHGYIIAAASINRIATDAYVGISILEKIEGTVKRFNADGAYDSQPMYKAPSVAGASYISIVILPKKTAIVDSRSRRLGANAPTPSRESVKWVGANGKESGANQQAHFRINIVKVKPLMSRRPGNARH